MNGVGKVDEVAPAVRVFNVKVGVNVIFAGVVDLLAAALHLCSASFGFLQIVADHGRFRIGEGDILQTMAHGRGGENAVFKRDVANCNRFKNMRIIWIAHSYSLLVKNDKNDQFEFVRNSRCADALV